MSLTLDHAPLAPFLDPRAMRLPGTGPIAPSEWLHRDATHAAQMACRDRLIAERPEVVIARLPGAEAAEAELLEMVAENVLAHHGAARAPGGIRRVDGVTVPREGCPLAAAGRLAQEDFLILDRRGDEHVLVAGVLCFPSRWSLREKLGQRLTEIHARVPDYDMAVAPRVQRLFDGVRPGRPLARANWLFHGSAELHLPGKDVGPKICREGELWLRVERQTVSRLPASGAAVFTVRTFLTRVVDLSAEQRRGLRAAFAALGPVEAEYKGGAMILDMIDEADARAAAR